MGLVLMNGEMLIGSVFPVEFLTKTEWDSLLRFAPRLLITSMRAQQWGIQNAGEAVLLPCDHTDFHSVKALADPTLNSLPTVPTPLPAPVYGAALLQLMKHAALLPAMVIIDHQRVPGAELILDMAALKSPHTVAIIEGPSALLPIEGAEKATLTSYRSRHSTSVHLVLKIGDWQAEDAPLVRVHSSCVTGDILGSLRCDCGDQLRMALAHITKAGSGILIYLHQEGRGIGITNKLRAYALQERGFDTYEANQLLGYDEDERDFSIASAILHSMHISKIQLLTNNPQKISALEKQGITVTQRIAISAPSGAHNHAYLNTKANKSGHLF